MESSSQPIPTRATIKVCCGEKCTQKGALDIYKNLKEGIPSEEALVLKQDNCLGACERGPNLSLNDNLVTDVTPFLAVELIREKLLDPSCRADGLGSQSIEKLDALLDDMGV